MSDQENETWKSLAGICANICIPDNEFCQDTNVKMIKNILKHNNCIDCPIPAAPYFKQKGKVEFIGYTPLRFALKEENFEAFKCLIDQGADYTLKNFQGETILHQAFRQSHCFSVKRDTLWKSLSRDSFMNSLLSTQVNSRNASNPRNDNGLTHMHIACAINHVKSVEFFLMNGVSASHAVDFESPSLPGYSSLHIAIQFCAYETAMMLLKRGADVHLKDAQGISPLHLLIKLDIEAQSHGGIFKNRTLKTAIFDLAVRASNSDLIIDENGLTALHVACTLQDTELVEKLLKNGQIDFPVNRDSPLFSGYTALHFAAHFSVETLQLLVSNGGNIASKDCKGTTPFDIFLKRNDTFACDVPAFIASQPSWRDIRFTDGKTSLLDFVSAMKKEESLLPFLRGLNSINAPLQLDSPLWPGYTVLHLLALFSFKHRGFITYDDHLIDAIKLCLEMGADVGIQDIHGDSALHLGCNLQKDKLVDLLLSAPKVSNSVNENGLSHLHIACAAGHSDFVRRLFNSSSTVDVNKPVGISWHKFLYECQWLDTTNAVNIAKGSTALHIAVIKGNLELAEILLSHGANCALKNEDGLTTVHLLLGRCGLRRVKENLAASILSSYNSLLVSDDACVDAALACGLTELHVVSYRGDEVAVERLLDLGADVNARITYERSLVGSLSHLQYYSGCTSLELAVRRGNDAIVKILLERGADVLAKRDDDGMTLAYHILQYRRSNKFVNVLVDKLERDVALQDRMLSDSGLTMLHVACALMNFALIKRLCNDAAQVLNVNARMHTNSPIWPGCTPLHLLIITSKESVGTDEMDAVKLLLDCGADVTLANSDQKTPIHEDFERFSVQGPRFANLLLKSQKDFNKNTVSLKGISHFHIACSIKEVAVVEKFLQHGVDVKLPISNFCEIYGGFTPLHLATLHHLKDIFMFLKKRRIDYNHVPDYISSEIQIDPFNVASVNDYKKTVDLLLQYGADPNTRDRTGNTPLHAAVLSETLQEDVGESLSRAGADWNVKNLLDETPLEVMLSSGHMSRRSFEYFLRCGGNINSYSPAREEGAIPKIFRIWRGRRDDLQKCLCEALSNAPDMNYFDEMGRSLIHNVVSHSRAPFTRTDYINFIEFFGKLGHDVDHRDKKGRTALHLAIEFWNLEAVDALLDCGAHISVFAQSDMAMSILIEKLRGNRTSRIGKSLLRYICKLELRGIEVGQKLLNIYLDSSANLDDIKKICSDEITLSKSIKIGPHALTLHDFLSNTGVVAAYPILPLIQRQAIIDYFRNNNALLLTIFPHISGVLKLQFKKAFARVALFEPAKSVLSILAGRVIHDPCSEAVLRFLTNRDLENLTASADIEL